MPALPGAGRPGEEEKSEKDCTDGITKDPSVQSFSLISVLLGEKLYRKPRSFSIMKML
jgi:hypothetical protein